MEFIVANQIGLHPMALARYPKLRDVRAKNEIERRLAEEDPHEFFIKHLSESMSRPLGGQEFEPTEENPMLGFRGASRYYDARYADGFALECQALLRVAVG